MMNSAKGTYGALKALTFVLMIVGMTLHHNMALINLDKSESYELTLETETDTDSEEKEENHMGGEKVFINPTISTSLFAVQDRITPNPATPTSILDTLLEVYAPPPERA